MTDKVFNGKEKLITLRTRGQLHGNIMVELKTLSRDFYDYEITSDIQWKSDGDPLAQPINVYDNITNGFGIFAGYSSSRRTNNEAQTAPRIVSISENIVRRKSKVVLTVENLGPVQNFTFISVTLKGPDAGYSYMPGVRTSENTVEFVVAENAQSGKVAVRYDDLIGVSDFEVEVVD
jgi:hypothetical protein